MTKSGTTSLKLEKQDFGYPGNDIKLYLIVKLQFQSLQNVEYRFITITLDQFVRVPCMARIQLLNRLLKIVIGYLKPYSGGKIIRIW